MHPKMECLLCAQHLHWQMFPLTPASLAPQLRTRTLLTFLAPSSRQVLDIYLWVAHFTANTCLQQLRTHESSCIPYLVSFIQTGCTAVRWMNQERRGTHEACLLDRLCVSCEGDQLQEKLGIDTDPRNLGNKIKSGAKSALPSSLQLDACIALSCFCSCYFILRP